MADSPRSVLDRVCGLAGASGDAGFVSGAVRPEHAVTLPGEFRIVPPAAPCLWPGGYSRCSRWPMLPWHLDGGNAGKAGPFFVDRSRAGSLCGLQHPAGADSTCLARPVARATAHTGDCERDFSAANAEFAIAESGAQATAARRTKEFQASSRTAQFCT